MPKAKAKVYRLDEMSIREIILDRLSDLGRTPYQLARYGGCNASRSTVHRFLDEEGRNTFSGNVEDIMSACGLAVVVVETPPEWGPDAA